MRIIAGRWGGRRIEAPRGRNTRPTTDRVREAWMSIIAPDLPGARVLDLFAGSGALGIEALSRGATHVTFVEQAPIALRTLSANLRSLGAEASAEVVRSNALRYAESLERGSFDIALADPPYGSGVAEALVRRFTDVPFARLLCIEHGARDPIPEYPGADTRRYGDTLLSFFPAHS